MKVLITGGTGTFGHAMTRRLLADTRVSRLVIYSRDEQKQEQMARAFPHEAIRFFIGDVRDQSRLEFAMRDIDTVFHAAALKIVPIAEYNPYETVQTNIHGSENVTRAAIRARVARAVLLSSDKAVNPVNLYGASKLAAEKIFMAASNFGGSGGPVFSAVRYGNVVGSRGSVVPLFQQIAERGETLFPITHYEMTRFFITIDQAIDFVLSSTNVMQGRDIFIPKIPSVRVRDIPYALVDKPSLSIVGIRPGEKLHEVLLTEDESRNAYDSGDRYIIRPEPGNLPAGFRYSSDNNADWLTVAQLETMI